MVYIIKVTETGLTKMASAQAGGAAVTAAFITDVEIISTT